ncbi:MAG: hypothetical protein NTX22_15330 [Ignavibacteriales bacterium]|nr:hypothetical protein [Ignavibacteriales bacterium]
MNKYKKAIRENVCSVCVDSSDSGECTLTEIEICAVEKFLPQIVKVVHSIQSDDVFDYVDLLRKNVCVYCRAQDEINNCYLREDANCSLDRYFPLIVETIQKVDKTISV